VPGDFNVVAVLKGQLSGPKKYLWASTIPGCRLWLKDPRLMFIREKTRAWFLRDEGGVLRPRFDYNTFRYLGVFPEWDRRSQARPRRQFGALLLTPLANGDTLEDYAGYLWHIGDIACDLLGTEECARRVRSMADLGSPKLKQQSCRFLKAELQQPCNAR